MDLKDVILSAAKDLLAVSKKILRCTQDDTFLDHQLFIPKLLRNAKFVSRMNDENNRMVSEKNEGIVNTISSFLQRGILLFSRLADDRKLAF